MTATKRVLSIVLALIAVFSAFTASTSSVMAASPTPTTAYNAVKKAYGKKFPLSSKNRVKNNRRVFGVKIKNCTSYYAASKTTGSKNSKKEYIIFIAKTKNSSTAKKVQSQLKEYISNEKNSMNSYLSPTGKKLFKNAKTGVKGKYAYLVMLDTTGNKKAINAIKKNLK